MLTQYKHARKVGVPLVAINTPDQPATVEQVLSVEKYSVIRWDFSRGAVGIDKKGPIDQETGIATSMGQKYILSQFPNPVEDTVRLDEFLRVASEWSKCAVIVLNAHKFMDEPAVMQAICNLRESFKYIGSCLVLLAPSHNLPSEFGGDTLLLEEPLPDKLYLQEVVKDLASDMRVEVDEATVDKAGEALAGLSVFAAEQATSLATTREDGMKVSSLWARKEQKINSTDGLRVWKGGEAFPQIGGSDNIKSYLSRLLVGPGAPNVMVFMDEIDKSAGSAGAEGDTSGVSQDQLNVLLTWMQDSGATGMIFIGPPGSGKSMVAKATGNEGGIPTVQFDLGGMKGSLVGESERMIRNAVKVVDAIGQGKVLVIATCNRISSLRPELRRRFNLGTFFFDLPSELERQVIWNIYLEKYQLVGQELPADEDWTGAEIRQCCDVAWRLNCTLAEAAQFIVPVAKSAPKEISDLRAQADGRFISAGYKGVFRLAKREQEVGARRREVSLD